MDNYYINRILEEKKITEFLNERGIYPVTHSADKSIYRCPLHPGDNDPSFMVYPVGVEGRSYQTYYCFGCHKGGDLDNLIESLYSVKSPHVEAYVDDKSVITILKERGLLDSFSSLVAVTKRKGLDCTMTLNRLENDVEYFIYIDDGDQGDSGYIYFRFKNADRHPEAYKIFVRGLIGQFQSEPTIIHLGNKN